jgi:hypothetical protein
MKRIFIGTVLILGGMLSSASADTYVFRDTIRPHGHERSAAVRHADGRKCGTRTRDRVITDVPAFEQCMLSYGWVLDHIVAEPPAYVDNSNDDAPVIDNSSSDDSWRAQRDFEANQEMLNTQQMLNDQQQLINQQDMVNQQNYINNMNSP